MGLPGTGLSYTTSLSGSNRQQPLLSNMPARQNSAGGGCVLIAVVIGLLLIVGTCSSGSKTGSSTTAPPASEKLAYVSASAANCRMVADKNATIVTKLPRGTQAFAVGVDGKWTRVRVAEQTCWVSSELLSQFAPVPARSANPAMPLLSSSSPSSSARQPRQSRAVIPSSSGSRSSKRSHKRSYEDGSCPCSGERVCIGPRGGRYCITSGGNKRYGV